MNSVKMTAIAAIMAAFAPMASQAATVDIQTSPAGIWGSQNWYMSASYHNQTDSRNVLAGAFQLTGKDEGGNVSDFMAFCLSPFEWLSLPKTYVVGTSLSALTSTMVDQLSALANGAWAMIDSAKTAGAFQLAAWEIVGETDTAAGLHLNTGDFIVTGASEAGAMDLAQSWLDKVSDGSFFSKPSGITVYSENGTQDLLTYTPPAPVPLPATFGFLVAGLAAFAAIGRARRV